MFKSKFIDNINKHSKILTDIKGGAPAAVPSVTPTNMPFTINPSSVPGSVLNTLSAYLPTGNTVSTAAHTPNHLEFVPPLTIFSK